jgi:RNA polymerase sigma-70 factor (ECF subfamily)
VRSDLDLLAAWRGGDPGAGSELLRRHFDELLRFFLNKVDDGVEDLLQRTMLACVESRDRFRGDSSFRTYLFRVARNEVYAHWRRRRSDRQHLDTGVSSVADLAASPSRVLAQRHEQRVLLEALRGIPLDFQIALELHYWEQLSTVELSEVLEIPQGTVKSRLRRGRELLHERMAALGVPLAEADQTGALDDWARSLRDQVRTDTDEDL